VCLRHPRTTTKWPAITVDAGAQDHAVAAALQTFKGNHLTDPQAVLLQKVGPAGHEKGLFSYVASPNEPVHDVERARRAGRRAALADQGDSATVVDACQQIAHKLRGEVLLVARDG